jgi:hypothetical protein
MQEHLAPGQWQRFPFWSWKDTRVDVKVTYERKVFLYQLDRGSLGLFRNPRHGVMEFWTSKGEQINLKKPGP